MDIKIYVLIILVSCLHTVSAAAVQVRVTQDPDPVLQGGDVDLLCEVKDKEVDWTEWVLPDNEIASHNCTPLEDHPHLNFTCYEEHGNEYFLLQIWGTDYDRDDGVYTCVHNETSEAITLDVYVPITMVNTSDDVTVEVNGTQELVCQTDCAYPTPEIKWSETPGPILMAQGSDTTVPCDGTTKLFRTTSVYSVDWKEATGSVFECCATIDNKLPETCQEISVTYEPLPTTTPEVTTPTDAEQVPTTTQPQTPTEDANGDSTTTNQGTQPEEPTTTVDATQTGPSTTTIDTTQPGPSTTTIDATQPGPSTTTIDATQQTSSTTPENSATTRLAGHLVVTLLSVSSFLIFN